MSVVTFFSASYCHAEEVARETAGALSCDIVNDADLFRKISGSNDVSSDRLEQAMHATPSLFNSYTHEKEKLIALLRSSMAQTAAKDGIVFSGSAGLLLPKTLSNVLRVCLVAGPEYRKAEAARDGSMTGHEAEKQIKKDDEAKKRWTRYLHHTGPWDPELYDIVISMDNKTVDQAADMIIENVLKPVVASGPGSRKAMDDFLLACGIYEVLAQDGHDVELECTDGEVTVIINRYVVRLGALENELKQAVSDFPGVRSVKTRVGPGFRRPAIYPALELPMKILLVDDEKEFADTLSERLQTRNLGPAVAYNGEDALSIVEADSPDVMVLDMRMPGIDGMEVLRRVKKENPSTEVIVLTGHGSEKEKALALRLGAFAYLLKPADIDVLSDTVRRAYEKAGKHGDGKRLDEEDEV